MHKKTENIHSVFEAALRQDFYTFAMKFIGELNPSTPILENWHIEAICHKLELVRLGVIKRLIINLPPRSLKSQLVSVAWPAYLLGMDPAKRIISATYGADLGVKLTNDFRRIVSDPLYQRVFRSMRISLSKNTETEVATTQNGHRLGISIGGPVTGRGGDILVVDDPIKPEDALSQTVRDKANSYFFSSLLSRLDDKVNGAIVVVMQRVHVDDLSGVLLRSGGDWTLLSLPAIAPADEHIEIGQGRFHFRREGDVLQPQREPLEVLTKIQNQIGTYLWNAQYQQDPTPPGGNMINPAWIKRYKAPFERGGGGLIIQSWDTAAKDGVMNDFSVCTTWLKEDNNYYLLHVSRGRWQYPELKQRVLALADTYKPNVVLIEETTTGIALGQELQSGHTRHNFKKVAVHRSKVERMSVHTATFEAGRVYFPDQAPWLAELERELFAFPYAQHDDQVDSISQALAYKRGYGMMDVVG